jgi:hypothetical protein
MSANGGRRRRGGRRPRPGSRKVDFWGDAATPEQEVGPIVPASDPTALLRSLGSPPLQGRSAIAEYYLESVVRRAARVATALAATAGLLGDDDSTG